MNIEIKLPEGLKENHPRDVIHYEMMIKAIVKRMYRKSSFTIKRKDLNKNYPYFKPLVKLKKKYMGEIKVKISTLTGTEVFDFYITRTLLGTYKIYLIYSEAI